MRLSGASAEAPTFLAVAKGDTGLSSFLLEASLAEADLAKISEMLLTDGDKRDRFSGDDLGTGGSSCRVELDKQDNPTPILGFGSACFKPGNRFKAS